MIDLTEAYIKSTAFNDSAFANAKKLANGGKIVNTYITEDKSLLFGECMGSGKSNYKVSVDFIDPAVPVFRCSCPSRQIPCKHSTALLYAYLLKPNTFANGEVPEDVASKREKIEKRAERKKDEEVKPKKVNVTAFVKKMKAQLEGIELVEQFISECLMTGLASISLTQIKTYKKELVKELGNYYLPEHQGKVEHILDTLERGNYEEDKAAHYKKVMNMLTSLQALDQLTKSTLEKGIEEKKSVDATSAYAFTKFGYIWKAEELKNLNLYKENGRLIELGFYDYQDQEKKANIDKGFYLDLNTTDEIYETLNIRPFKLDKRLKEEDSQFEIIEAPEFVVYPGELNKRIRFTTATTTKVTEEDLLKVRSLAKKDYKAALKVVKTQLKDTLSDRHPVMLVHYKELIKCGEHFMLKDEQGETILLGQTKEAGMEETLLPMHFILDEADLEDQVMLGMFEYQEENASLIMQPISIITKSAIKRLLG